MFEIQKRIEGNSLLYYVIIPWKYWDVFYVENDIDWHRSISPKVKDWLLTKVGVQIRWHSTPKHSQTNSTGLYNNTKFYFRSPGEWGAHTKLDEGQLSGFTTVRDRAIYFVYEKHANQFIDTWAVYARMATE